MKMFGSFSLLLLAATLVPGAIGVCEVHCGEDECSVQCSSSPRWEEVQDDTQLAGGRAKHQSDRTASNRFTGFKIQKKSMRGLSSLRSRMKQKPAKLDVKRGLSLGMLNIDGLSLESLHDVCVVAKQCTSFYCQGVICPFQIVKIYL